MLGVDSSCSLLPYHLADTALAATMLVLRVSQQLASPLLRCRYHAESEERMAAVYQDAYPIKFKAMGKSV